LQSDFKYQKKDQFLATAFVFIHANIKWLHFLLKLLSSMLWRWNGGREITMYGEYWGGELKSQ